MRRVNITLLIIFLIYGLLILLPPITIWRVLVRSTSQAWARLVLALVGPFIATFVLVVLGWLPAYSGQCGGWLGETTSCSFVQYAIETLYWAAMSLVMPGILGIGLGVATLIFGLIRRRSSRLRREVQSD